MTAGTILWNGAPLAFRTGETVAQALHRAGIRQFGQHATDQPRALFCGIGHCQNCLVITHDGGPKEACLLVCRDGLNLSSTGAVENG